MEVLNNYQREKLDESNDEEFYSDPKFVYHLDANFRQNLSDLYQNEIAESNIYKLMKDEKLVNLMSDKIASSKS